jgi:hypothetical protein
MLYRSSDARQVPFRRWLARFALAAVALMGCDGALDRRHPDGGTNGGPSAVTPGKCVDPELGNTGPATVHGRTPLGSFAAAGAWAFNQCLSLLLKQVDARGCLGQTLLVSTDLLVPPGRPLDGSPLPVRLTVFAEGTPPPRDTGVGTLVLDAGSLSGHEGTLAGRLTARDGDWLLDGSFTAPWRYAECK